MYFGADYYPEHWPEERWPIDAKMMKEANINIVRVAEFSWVKLEPEEGSYNFEWLDKAIEILGTEEIKVVIGTPTATPPKWLMDKYPEIYPVSNAGRRYEFGIRRHYCPNNKIYWEYTKNIVEKLSDHYKDHPSVVAWQIDNEFGDQCYCESCLKEFRLWLKAKYGFIDRLNDEWGTIFWSQTYGNWNEIIIPQGYKEPISYLLHNPGLSLDYFRFSSDSYVKYQKLQADIIRKYSQMPITHNFMVQYAELDYYNLGKDLDFISLDNYPILAWRKSSYSRISMAHDHTRCIKDKNFWLMEEQSGPCGWMTLGDTPEPGQIRLWTYQAIAHGAEAVIYFRWRACTFGREQYWYGILDHDGIPRRRYREIQRIGEELKSLSELIVDSKVKAQVAIIKSYDNLWSHRISPHNPKFDYNILLISYYDALLSNHVNVDVSSVNCDFSKYKLVFMPAFDLMTEDIKKKCEEYVKDGGTLVITFRSGTRNWNNRMTTLTLPGEFKDIAGVELEEFDSIGCFGREIGVKGNIVEGTASIWCDVLKSNGAEVIATYDSHYYKEMPAVTVNNYGKGKVYYVGCDLNSDAMNRFLEEIIHQVQISSVLKTKIYGVEIVEKEKDGKIYYIVLNHNNVAVNVSLEGEFTDLLSGRNVREELPLEIYGVVVLIKKNA